MALIYGIDFKYDPNMNAYCVECDRMRYATNVWFYDEKHDRWYPICSDHAFKAAKIVQDNRIKLWRSSTA